MNQKKKTTKTKPFQFKVTLSSVGTEGGDGTTWSHGYSVMKHPNLMILTEKVVMTLFHDWACYFPKIGETRLRLIYYLCGLRDFMEENPESLNDEIILDLLHKTSFKDFNLIVSPEQDPAKEEI